LIYLDVVYLWLQNYLFFIETMGKKQSKMVDNYVSIVFLIQNTMS